MTGLKPELTNITILLTERKVHCFNFEKLVSNAGRDVKGRNS